MSQILSSGGGGGGSGVLTLTGNSGGAVSTTAGNINVLGSGGIAVAGNPGTSTLTITSSPQYTVTSVNNAASPYTVLSTDQYIKVDTSGGAVTIRLPNTTTTGRFVIVKDSTGTAAASNITVTTVGGAVNIDGATTFVMNTNYESGNFLWDGTAYEIF